MPDRFSDSATYPRAGNVRRPAWLKKSLPVGADYRKTDALLDSLGLTTVCREAGCPNRWECYSRGTATFLILGDRCTRNCRFCGVNHGTPGPPDPSEPEQVADAAFRMHLRHVVVTSVTRDDLADGGAHLFAATIRAIREKLPMSRIEVLIPDFKGDPVALEMVLSARPDILNHNMETVPRLYPLVRPEASYRRSLTLLARADQADLSPVTKSGLMLGLGETDDEVITVLSDLRKSGCRVLTFGQYLQPTPRHYPVNRFIPPESFDAWRGRAIKMGFSAVAAGPFVRSSYRADALVRSLIA